MDVTIWEYHPCHVDGCENAADRRYYPTGYTHAYKVCCGECMNAGKIDEYPEGSAPVRMKFELRILDMPGAVSSSQFFDVIGIAFNITEDALYDNSGNVWRQAGTWVPLSMVQGVPNECVGTANDTGQAR